MKKRIIFLGTLIAVAIGIFTSTVHANPLAFNGVSFYPQQATTSPYYVASSASKSIVYDTFNQGSTNPSPFKADSATLLLQSTASSTSSVYKISYSYSQDGIDYYTDNITLPATTTTFNINTGSAYQFTAIGTTLALNALPLPVPTRFVKVTVSLTGAAGAFWAEIVPSKQFTQD